MSYKLSGKTNPNNQTIEVKVKKKIAVQISPDSSKFVTKRYFKESYCKG